MEKEALPLRNNHHAEKIKGFTLLESLIALLIVSLISLLFLAVLENSKSVIKQLETSEEKAWHIFLIQVENELDCYYLEEVFPNKIVLKKKENNHSFWLEHKLGKIVKVDNGGYQPMLIKVKKALFEKKINSVAISVQLENNQQFTGSWVITKKEALNE